MKDRPVFHPFRYHREAEQCLINAEEWKEVRVGKALPNDGFVTKFL